MFIGMWPWVPFLMACLARVFPALSLCLFFEGLVLDFAPASLRSVIYNGGICCIVLTVGRSIFGGIFAAPVPDMAMTTESGKFHGETVSWACSALRGWRGDMEDAHVMEAIDPSIFPEALLFAVLDGHGGKDVSLLASKLLRQEVEKIGQEAAPGSNRLASTLEKALPILDEKLRAGTMGLGRAMPGFLHPFFSQGCTAVVAAVDFTSREVVVANVGDSRAMLIRNGKAIGLSEDHKPENPKERARIVQAGGRVVKCPGGCYRVDGNLNLSRALGDFHMKQNFDLSADKQKVTAFPDVTRTKFVGGPKEVLLVACDGLFERCTNQDIADIVWPRVEKGMPLRRICEELLIACCARSRNGRPIEPGTDNETCIIVTLPEAKENGTSAALSQQSEKTNGHESGGGVVKPSKAANLEVTESEG